MVATRIYLFNSLLKTVCSETMHVQFIGDASVCPLRILTARWAHVTVATKRDWTLHKKISYSVVGDLMHFAEDDITLFGRGMAALTWSLKLLETYVFLCLCLVEWTAAGIYRYVGLHETTVHRCSARRAPSMSLWKTTCQWIYSRHWNPAWHMYGTTYLIKNDAVSKTLQRHEQCDPGLTCTGICDNMHTSTDRLYGWHVWSIPTFLLWIFKGRRLLHLHLIPSNTTAYTNAYMHLAFSISIWNRLNRLSAAVLLLFYVCPSVGVAFLL